MNPWPCLPAHPPNPPFQPTRGRLASFFRFIPHGRLNGGVGRERRKSLGASGGQVRWKLWAVAVVWIITMIEVRHSGMDAGQIGRTADLHGFAARRVPDMDVPYASSVHGRQTSRYGKTCRKL